MGRPPLCRAWLAIAAATVALAVATTPPPPTRPLTATRQPAPTPGISNNHPTPSPASTAPSSIRTDPPTRPPPPTQTPTAVAPSGGAGTGNAACSSFLVYNTTWPATYGTAGNRWTGYSNDAFGHETYDIQSSSGGNCGSIPTTFRRGFVSHHGNTTLTFASPVSHIYIVTLHHQQGDDITVSGGQVIAVPGCASSGGGYFLVRLSQPTTVVVLHDHDSGGGSGVSILLADCTSGSGSPTVPSGSSPPSRSSTERPTPAPASTAPSAVRTDPPTRPPAGSLPPCLTTPCEVDGGHAHFCSAYGCLACYRCTDFGVGGIADHPFDPVNNATCEEVCPADAPTTPGPTATDGTLSPALPPSVGPAPTNPACASCADERDWIPTNCDGHLSAGTVDCGTSEGWYACGRSCCQAICRSDAPTQLLTSAPVTSVPTTPPPPSTSEPTTLEPTVAPAATVTAPQCLDIADGAGAMALLAPLQATPACGPFVTALLSTVLPLAISSPELVGDALYAVVETEGLPFCNCMAGMDSAGITSFFPIDGCVLGDFTAGDVVDSCAEAESVDVTASFCALACYGSTTAFFGSAADGICCQCRAEAAPLIGCPGVPGAPTPTLTPPSTTAEPTPPPTPTSAPTRGFAASKSPTAAPAIKINNAESSTGEDDNSSSTTLWVVIVVLFLLILMVAGFLFMKKRNTSALSQNPAFENPVYEMTPNPIATRALDGTAATSPPLDLYGTAMPVGEAPPGSVYGGLHRGGAEVNPTYSAVELQQFGRSRAGSVC